MRAEETSRPVLTHPASPDTLDTPPLDKYSSNAPYQRRRKTQDLEALEPQARRLVIVGTRQARNAQYECSRQNSVRDERHCIYREQQQPPRAGKAHTDHPKVVCPVGDELEQFVELEGCLGGGLYKSGGVLTRLKSRARSQWRYQGDRA
jgi:hypothetical protein